MDAEEEDNIAYAEFVAASSSEPAGGYDDAFEYAATDDHGFTHLGMGLNDDSAFDYPQQALHVDGDERMGPQGGNAGEYEDMYLGESLFHLFDLLGHLDPSSELTRSCCRQCSRRSEVVLVAYAFKLSASTSFSCANGQYTTWTIPYRSAILATVSSSTGAPPSGKTRLEFRSASAHSSGCTGRFDFQSASKSRFASSTQRKAQSPGRLPSATGQWR